jgi:uncharacterized Zn-binding protein involved in type VI secretion
MAIGYFIGLGDKTSCGGKVLDGHDGVIWNDLLHAREGDRVSCGVDGKTYEIRGGVSYYISHGRAVAGTLDSVSTCPCQATLTPSTFDSSYVGEERPAQSTRWASATSPLYASITTHCDERFQLLDHRRVPLGQLDYVLLQDDQCVAFGKLDERGRSDAHGSAIPTSLSIAISAPSPLME